MIIDTATIGVFVGAAATTLGGLSTLCIAVWRMGTNVAAFKASVERLEEKFGEFKKTEERIDRIPLIEQRVTQLERWAQRAHDETSRNWTGGEVG